VTLPIVAAMVAVVRAPIPDRLFGFRRRVSSVAPAADNPAELTAALRRMAY
jgi:hypothetical protein